MYVHVRVLSTLKQQEAPIAGTAWRGPLAMVVRGSMYQAANLVSGKFQMGCTAADNVGVTQVTWVNDRGGNGSASGTNNWTANGISLQKGNNVITVTARDAAGKFNTDVLTVDYTPGTPATATNVTLTLAWDPNPAADNVQGYYVYSGPSANSISNLNAENPWQCS